ncbi:hypothetical protein [Streptomyces sp. NBC_01483]|uniref:hypothetical protein n=1 Tax=Streptomyces sp. NBC_01483 TaxID=2903883 RepID=UPI003FCD4D06
MTRGVRHPDTAGVSRIVSSTCVHPYVRRALGRAGNFTDMDLPDFGIPQQLASRMSMAEQYEYLRLKVSALAESGRRIDHFEVRRGA